MKVYFIPIGPARLSRFEEIGRRLGHHEWVVEDGSLNIWSDPRRLTGTSLRRR
ncbi:hypothetical protein [Kitasatospora xanthocidica]|uniref:hypothetical protein n=1 Tax=Kitasatospora xanthocidica TaxID=83382 RepID=UPI001C703918|nr:hypothetical protein [Kitasatospora xanthocidica]